MKDELFEQVKGHLQGTEIPDPEAGWQQMLTLLDASRKPSVFWGARYSAAASLALILGAWALSIYVRTGLTHIFPPEKAGKSVAGLSGSMRAQSFVSGGIAPPDAKINRQGQSDGSGKHNEKAGGPLSRTADLSAGGTGISVTAADLSTAPGQTALLKMIAGNSDNICGKPQALPIERELRPIGSVGPLHLAHHSRWSFQAGLGANFPGSLRTVTVNNQKKWKAGIFPEVAALYRLGAKFSLKAGMAGPSPVAYSRSFANSSLSIGRDSITGQYTQTLSQSQKIGRLLYLDLPVSVQWELCRHLSLEGGVQCSHLMTQQDESHISKVASTGFLPYFQDPQVPGPAQAPPPLVRRNDLRYLVGASFHWHRISAGLQYQRGVLQAYDLADEHGKSVENRTSIASMQVMYSLR